LQIKLDDAAVKNAFQRFFLESGTVPNLETLVIKHLQIKLDDAAVKNAGFGNSLAAGCLSKE